MQLSQPQLLQNKSFINNKWVSAQSGKTFEVTNPTDGNVITTVADCAAAETEQAIEAATNAFATWSRKTAKERSAVMRKWSRRITNEHRLVYKVTESQIQIFLREGII